MSDSQNLSPCKVNFNGALRRFLIARPAVWSDFEHKLRNVYNLPAATAIDVQYKDEEGDVISLNTDSELEDVLSMHALFTQIAPVRFDVLLRPGQDFPAPITSTTAATAAETVEPYNITQSADTQPEVQRERSNTITSDSNSDDGSLIEFEEAQETAILTESTLNQPIVYPQEDLYEAALRQEQEIIEAQKLQAPLFPSSVTSDDTMDLEETNKDESKKTSSRRSSKSSSPAIVPVAEFEALRMDSAAEVMDSIVASAIEQHAQDVAAAVHSHSESEEDNAAHVDPADPAEPEINESVPYGDRALIEQFQMLIQEFQHIIQNNPQLVTICGSIMNKIMSNVQVNVESFASYLQEAARNAQASAEEAAASAHEAAAEATRSCPFGGSGSENPFLSNPFFFQHRGPFGPRGHEDSFSGCHDNEGGESSDRSHHHGHHHGHHRGGRGGRGGCFGRGGGHQWGFGSLFSPMPPMPPMPGMPPMPPMPGMPAMPPMPSMPGMPGMFPTEGTSVPSTKPSPFSYGFPFQYGAPGGCKKGNNFRFRGDRPAACDTESSEKKRDTCSEKNKNASSSSGEVKATHQQGESSSSAQQQPQMTEIGNGWTWTLLPSKTADADPSAEASSSSARPKYGWVWNGGDENGNIENPEPAPIYVESGDEEMTEPTHDVPQGPFDFGRRGDRGSRGRGGFAFFRGRGGPRGGHPFAFHPHGPHHVGPHGHGHGPHHHRHHRRHSGSKSGEEGGHAESSSEERLKRRQTFHEQRRAHEEQRKVHEEQRKVQEEQRKVHEEQRK
ncbi:hypothetical protein BGZ97_003593, partial [Linnemannia gamsii]